MRATARLADVSRTTVDKLLVDAGRACYQYQRKVLINLRCRQIQCDEIWSFIYAKQKNVPAGKEGGDVWTWVAIDPETKLVPAWHIGQRSLNDAIVFITDLYSRLSNQIQLTTDGFENYVEAIELNFGADIDYAQLIKHYKGKGGYSFCNRLQKERIVGEPNFENISTSHVERQNLTMRMAMRRFTRQSNGFSKKIENHRWAVSLHFMHYNFCRLHHSLDVTPAMEAGVAKTLYGLDFIVGLLDD